MESLGIGWLSLLEVIKAAPPFRRIAQYKSGCGAGILPAL